MDVFQFRESLGKQYERFSRSFCRIRAEDIKTFVDEEYQKGRFWPSPLIQLNPNFVSGGRISDLVAEGLLHKTCGQIFRAGKTPEEPTGSDMTLHKHQEEAIRIARKDESYVLTTGTGSGKSLSNFVPIVDHVLRERERTPRSRVSPQS